MFLFSCHVEIRKHLICFLAGCVQLNIRVFVWSWSGTTEENLNKLIQNVKIEHETGYILNWKHLGVPVVSTVSPRLLSPLALLLFQLPHTNDLFGCDML